MPSETADRGELLCVEVIALPPNERMELTGKSITVLGQPSDIGGVETQAPYVIVENVDSHYDRAKASGADIVSEPEDQPYSGRLYSCRDIEGHLWYFGDYDPWS